MDTIPQADETPLSTESQPLKSVLNTLLRRVRAWPRRAGRGKAYSVSSLLAAFVLVGSSLSTNLTASRSLATGLDTYVAPDPKLKAALLVSLDQYTPVVSEAADADAIVTADIAPRNFVLQKPTVAKVTTRAESEAALAAANPVVPQTRTETVTYTVTEGDTLSSIASRFALNQSTIKIANSDTIKDVDRLRPGDTLKIPTENFSKSYIAQQEAKLQKQVEKTSGTKVALASSKRTVVVRNQASSSSGLDFARPAGSRGKNGYHDWALDIPPSGGLGIYAAEGGTVEEVATGWNGGYGNMIRINHGGGWATLYAHLSSIGVEPGQHVSRGEPIGIMGATGRTIPKGAVHLHFEIRHNGQKLNPIQYIQ